MELFAARGTAGVTVREVASAAEVSPGLVMYHYGSKAGLKEAVDQRASAFVEDMLNELTGVGEEEASTSLAGLFAERLEEEPALACCVRRLLADGGGAADSLFKRLFETNLASVRSLGQTGLVRPSQDEPIRVAFLLANDLAIILLRRQIKSAIGIDPLDRTGLVRWTSEVFDVYTHGLFESPTPTPEPDSTSPPPGPNP